MSIPKRAAQYWALFEASAARYELDVYLLAAICDHESLCGISLTPVGPTGEGDREHALGLMQIDKRYHGAFALKLMQDGTPAWQDAATNIDYGASILADNFDRFDGNEPCAIANYNASEMNIRHAVADITRSGVGPPPIEALIWAVDQVTTKKSYVSDVLARREQFLMPAPPRSSPPGKPSP